MEQQYLNLIRRILDCDTRDTRNGKVYSMFGAHLECDLSDGFPLLTTKRMFWKGIVEELAWFLRGSTNVEELRAKKVHIWDGNSEAHNYDAGPVYGFQWRHFGADYTDCTTDYAGKGIDQIKYIIDTLKTDPMSRRMVLSAWCPSQQAQMCLPPCHVMYQFYVETDNRLSVQMTQRSSDVFLGLPFNIASTALLTHLIAHQVGLQPGRVLIHIGDAHIYQEHVQACQLQLKRVPCEQLPSLHIDRATDDTLWEVQDTDIDLQHYTPQKRIRAPMIS
jgi:thymidylate synthase